MSPDKSSEHAELRAEVREAAARGASVEFKPDKESMIYQFSLRDWSPSGLGILVKRDSDIFKFIRVGQKIDVKLHKGDATLDPNLLLAEIRHISEPSAGLHPNHLIVGLKILDRI
ncbi:MAG TPA: hypothetical protein DHV36_11810 [Desulfobacteraceae bacterium]|nr:hypothetical protein [Desulfobacteraceae bacterium]|tara:strand:+ start:549 stop:893 length:345 start_codon:yes stop_codon:yes gene_type:complete